MRRWVPRPIDLAAAVVLTVASLVEVWLLAAPDFPVGRVTVTLAVGTLAFGWHRVAPLTALTVGLTCLTVVPAVLGLDPADYFGWFIATIALVVSAGYHARRPLLALAITFTLLATSIVVQKGWLVADIVFVWLLSGGAWLGGRAVADRTLRAQLSEQRAASAEEQAQWRAAVAVAEERLRIAREMHDVVSHSVSVMTLHVSGVRRLLRPDQVEERAALETVERTGRESLAEMHRMLGVLRGPEPADDSPSPGLGRLSELLETARVGGLQVELNVRGQVRPLPPGVDLAAYRIVQEAITNVLRHAAARRVACTVDYGATAIALGVEDDGAGDGSAGPGGHGLVGIRERVAAYGGTLEAGPRPDGGWAVRALLPVPPAEQPAPVPVAEETR